MAADLQPVTPAAFSDLMTTSFPCLPLKGESLAVGVSGGPDSMALCYLLSLWMRERKSKAVLHALSVDHGLRKESGAEVRKVGRWLKDWPGVRHHILTWKPKQAVSSRVQEQARDARYALMAKSLRRHNIKRLFVAHHLDDQAETVLFRLTRGTGLDGLAGMTAEQAFSNGLILCRPLLSVAKAALVQTCRAYDIPFLLDPSNESDQFTRGRMRRSMEALRGEGLTAERLGLTARRLARAKDALNDMAKKVFTEGCLENKTSRIVFSMDVLSSVPEEVGIRVLLKMMGLLHPPDPYGPRLERVEALFSDLVKPGRFRKRTLHKIVFARDDRAKRLILSPERSGDGKT
ncbi:MAG: tRNA lysidine(34) synthetase TilS [Alphaproteobacteria bacterium]|nr:tRNA lysidine(34) synthetase TilS [Alphaproteobacteria bacterium]